MAFGWSFPKLLIVITVLFFLFGVPLMAYVSILRERHLEKSRRLEERYRKESEP